MSTRDGHPAIDVLERLAAGEAVPDDVADHVDACASCRDLVEVVGRPSGRTGLWRTPTDDLVERAITALGATMLPVPGRPVELEHAADVRSAAGAVAPDGAQIVAGGCDGGEVSVVVRAPHEDAFWRIDVRVWPVDGAAVRVALVHGDHVVTVEEVEGEGSVRFEEIVPVGWTLEVHFPNGDVVTLADPSGSS